MKILIAPLAAMAELNGYFGRASAIALAARERQHEVAFCAAKDINFHEVEGVENFEAPCPSPLGIPTFLGKWVMKYAQLVGYQRQIVIRSFEEALYYIGAIASRFFPWDVASVRTAIRSFKPDIVYAEYRPAAIVAARLENVRVASAFSFPVQTGYASNPEYSQGVRDYLGRNNLPMVHSVLETFDWADIKFIASSNELEPIYNENIFHVGPIIPLQYSSTGMDNNHIVVYMGNGTILSRQLINSIETAFNDTKYSVYIASDNKLSTQHSNIHFIHESDLPHYLPGAAAYINHGGQISIMSGLIHGIPQIIYPGRAYERQYHANAIQKLGTGLVLLEENFNGEGLHQTFGLIQADPSISQKAKQVGDNLLCLGGADKIINILEVYHAEHYKLFEQN